MIGDVFEGFDPESFTWGRNADVREEDPELWHIVGPRMPRNAPVSPTHIAPCAEVLYSDSLETYRGLVLGPTRQPCSFCNEFLYQQTRILRDARKQAADKVG